MVPVLKKIVVLFFTFFFLSQFQIQARVVKGKVKCGGAAVSGVAVSDGVNVVKTDVNGHYSINVADDSRFVFISTPAGYESPVSDGTCVFYKSLEDGVSRYDFSLSRKEKDDSVHQIIAIADPQVYDRSEFPQLEQAVSDIRSCVESSGISCSAGICCGDITSFDHGLYGEINSILSESGLTFRYALGNHDMKVWGRSFESSLKEFEKVYGPPYYSFNIGKVHYVVLNDNFFIGRDYFYIGYLDEKQLCWLEKDLSYVCKGSTVMVAMHIPTTLSPEDRERFSYGDISTTLTNKKALYDILKPYKAHILSGHMHTSANQVISDSLYEHNIAALSGAWWCGDICLDGTPAGYKVFTVDGSDVSWRYKAVGMGADEVMSVYCSDSGDVLVNVWDWDEDWKVSYSEGEMVIEGAVSGFAGKDPEAVRLYSDPAKLKHKWISPGLCRHLFVLPAGKRTCDGVLTVTDRFGNTYRKEIVFKKEIVLDNGEN